jgi:hypothetical protein
MPDLEARLPEMLRHAAAGVHADDALARRTLRRARRRRARNAAMAGVSAGLLLLGLALGARALVSDTRLTPVDAGTPTPTAAASPSPTGPEAGLPEPVLRTRDAVLAAIETGNLEALQAFIDPDRFAYNFDGGSNPVPEWRKDPTVLEPLASILRMPFATREGTPDVGTIYVWPALTEADLTHLSDEERAMLAQLGISDRDVRQMLEAFGAYTGPRTGIAQDGTWLFYTVGGD